MLESEATLRQWVRQHQVTWEAAPRREMVDGGSLTEVGYEVRLYGRVRVDTETPGGTECAATYERLRAIASASLPASGGHTRCEIERFDSSLHMRPDGDWWPEVELRIQLTHPGAHAHPLDDREKECAERIQAALRRLGAQPGRWSQQQN